MGVLRGQDAKDHVQHGNGKEEHEANENEHEYPTREEVDDDRELPVQCGDGMFANKRTALAKQQIAHPRSNEICKKAAQLNESRPQFLVTGRQRRKSGVGADTRRVRHRAVLSFDS